MGGLSQLLSAHGDLVIVAVAFALGAEAILRRSDRASGAMERLSTVLAAIHGVELPAPPPPSPSPLGQAAAAVARHRGKGGAALGALLVLAAELLAAPPPTPAVTPAPGVTEDLGNAPPLPSAPPEIDPPAIAPPAAADDDHTGGETP